MTKVEKYYKEYFNVDRFYSEGTTKNEAVLRFAEWYKEQAIAEHEQNQWYYKKPRSNDKNLWGKDVLVERKNRVGDNYFSIDIMPLSGNIIRWRELPKPYQPTEKGGK